MKPIPHRMNARERAARAQQDPMQQLSNYLDRREYDPDALEPFMPGLQASYIRGKVQRYLLITTAQSLTLDELAEGIAYDPSTITRGIATVLGRLLAENKWRKRRRPGKQAVYLRPPWCARIDDRDPEGTKVPSDDENAS